MKLLVILPSLNDDTATGLVCRTLAGELTRLARVDCTIVAPGHTLTKLEATPDFDGRLNRIGKLCALLESRHRKAERWAGEAMSLLQPAYEQRSYDKILAVVSATGYHVLSLAENISNRHGTPLHLHFLDALPSPKHWGENELWRRAITAMVSKAAQNCSVITAINRQMLDYQIQRVDRRSSAWADINTGVIGLPISSSFTTLKARGASRSVGHDVLYFGSLSAQRPAAKLVQGFRLAARRGYPGRLIFQGCDADDVWRYAGVKIGQSNDVIRRPRQLDATAAFQGIGVLVDIDVPFAGDVFTSSKLMTYLGSSLPIVAVTTAGSPTSELLSQRNLGAIVVQHEPEAIAEALLRAVQMRPDEYIGSRRKLVQEQSPEEIASQLAFMRR